MTNYNEMGKVQVFKLMSPKQIKERLDFYTIGKHDVKKILALALSEHIKRIGSSLNLKKTNMLLLGATGSGKTHIVTALENIMNELDIPCVHIDTIKFSETTFAKTLIEKSDNNIILAQKSVVILENLDRIALNEKTSKKSMSKNKIQNIIGQVIEGKEIKVDGKILNTSEILFIATATFDDVDKKIEDKPLNKPYEVLEAKDLTEFGLNNFIIRKFQKVVAMPRLSQSDLIEILKQRDKNPLASYVKIFEADGITFEIEEAALPYIAERSMKNGLGVTGVYITLTSILTDFYFDVENLNEVEKCIITEDTMKNGKLKIINK